MRSHVFAVLVALASSALAVGVGACVGDPPLSTNRDASAGGDASPADGGGDGDCGDTTADPKNCGACGHACAATFTCTQGVCGNAAVELGSGANHSCVTLNNGDVYCWGANAFGQAGTTPSAKVGPTFIPRDVAANTFTSRGFAAGQGHTCGVGLDGKVLCWGNAAYGQLGDHQSSVDGGSLPKPTPGLPVTLMLKPIALASIGRGPEANHSCGVSDGGVVYCWGLDTAHQVSVLDASAPQPCNDGNDQCLAVASLALNEPAAQVAVGSAHTCSLDAKGAVRCWGASSSGQLGNNKHGNCFGCPVQPYLVTLAPASFVATGLNTTCSVLKADGSVACWGNNESAMLGHLPLLPDGGAADPCCSIDCGFSQGHPRCQDHPVTVPGIVGVKVLAVSDGDVCALKADGTVWCWGANDKGQLGRGTSDPASSPTPTQLATLSNVTEISAGANHFCALEKDGSVWCWGLNDQGQLGAGTANSSTPLKVTTLPQ